MLSLYPISASLKSQKGTILSLNMTIIIIIIILIISCVVDQSSSSSHADLPGTQTFQPPTSNCDFPQQPKHCVLHTLQYNQVVSHLCIHYQLISCTQFWHSKTRFHSSPSIGSTSLLTSSTAQVQQSVLDLLYKHR